MSDSQYKPRHVSIESYRPKPRSPYAASGPIVAFLLLPGYMYIVFAWSTTFLSDETGVWSLDFFIRLPFIMLFAAIPFMFLADIILTMFGRLLIFHKISDLPANYDLKRLNHFALLLRPFYLNNRILVLPDNDDVKQFGEGGCPPKDLANRWMLPTLYESLSEKERLELTIDQQSKAKLVYHNQQPEPVELFDAIATSVNQRLIAVGERKSEGGPGLILSDERSWQELVLNLINRAEVVVMMPWSSAGTTWELEQVIKKPIISKTIFIMPPVYEVEKEMVAFVDPLSGLAIAHGIEPIWVYRRHYRASWSLQVMGGGKSSLDPIPQLRWVVTAENDTSKGYFESKGFPYPKSSNAGCLFFYAANGMYCSPIPYNARQMEVFMTWRSSLLATSTEEGRSSTS